MLIQETKCVSDAFRHLYLEYIVIKRNDMRYLLRHHALEKVLRLTVFAGPGYEHKPAAVICKLEKYLDELQNSFGVKYRYAVHKDAWVGEKGGWFPLEDLPDSDNDIW